MLKRMLGSRWLILALALAVVPAAFGDSFSPGNPCLAERTTYYSDASHTTAIGGNEFGCYWGHYVWGQTSSFYSYENLGPCCSVCTAWGVCDIEP